mmetsp:Transcript_50435/g.134043  ORF Transcript_50435/g.134043 Transcript_50435/m.134043 type:complete len:577 (-) Transcript_50435:138-1868(-)|eukprot:CAMPEP_0194483624 /NCGR_PEP_ID=MMETSP0253-20130528/5170_1 /TAXON_ID=2966 /ORGANISM="Noctiluca scintillans" /LENGTH=576 /DNA_ID=CAMNT_0039323301 /DNA_START=90 /DNA_END=1820 /DNA_ORIENTATION=-
MSVLALGCIAYFVNIGHSASFLHVGEANGKEVRAIFHDNLRTDDHLSKYIEALRPQYNVMKNVATDTVGAGTARYMLHRLFVQLHGWSFTGLEPNTDATNSTSEALQNLLEDGFSASVHLYELAAMAATLDQLVHKETVDRLQLELQLYDVDPSTDMDEQTMKDVLTTYFMIFLKSGDISTTNRQSTEKRKALFARRYKDWDSTKDWMLNRVDHYVANSKVAIHRNLSMVTELAQDTNTHFNTFYKHECKLLKDSLTSLEAKQPGLVPLSTFYNQSLIGGHWAFTESADFLRTIGALDESNTKRANVILANYVAARPNCHVPSRLYAICCPDECQGLMNHVEKEIGSSYAEPEQLLSVVSQMSSDTVAAPRVLSEELRSRLTAASDAHGMVPIHGRLFSQWMHNAFPRECIYPHQAGTVNVWGDEEWKENMGNKSAQASREEMVEVVASDTCGLDDCHDTVLLPWSHEEELLDPVMPPVRAKSTRWPLYIVLVVCAFALRARAQSETRQIRFALSTVSVLLLIFVGISSCFLNWMTASVVLVFFTAKVVMGNWHLILQILVKAPRKSVQFEGKCTV